jgi:branched-chain amino acid aminotransferase
MSKVFLNGEIIDSADARLSVFESGFLYGSGLFETMRATDGKVFRIDDHIDRMFASAKELGIAIGGDKKYIYDAVYNTLDANDLKFARIRLTVSNGPMGPDIEQAPTVLVTATEFQAYPAEYYTNGVRVVLTDYRQNPTDPLCGHKSTCYNARLIALKDAQKKQATEALWFTTENKLAEGCVSSVFIVKDGKVFTPPLNTPVLDGIARKTVLEIAKEQGIEAEEKELFINDLLEADEVFITNVIMLMLPVTTVEARTIGSGKPGEITKNLLEKFQQLTTKG